jgi:predicted transcriptional regulator
VNQSTTVRVRDVMKTDFDLMQGMLTVKEALLAMRFPNTRALIIDKRNPDDEFGIVLIADIAKQVLAADRSPDRVNLYEIMAKPVLGIAPEMNIRYCARMMQRFGITLAPVIDAGQVIGVVSYHDLVLEGLMAILKEQPS